jgi:hypothetical protein
MLSKISLSLLVVLFTIGVDMVVITKMLPMVLRWKHR